MPRGLESDPHVVLVVVLVVAVIVIQGEVTIGAGINHQVELCPISAAHMLMAVGVLWDDGASFHVERVFVNLEITCHHLAALQHRARAYLVPTALWQPDVEGGEVAFHRGGDGSHQHVVAKHIFVAETVRLRTVRPVVVERAAERQTFIMGFARHGVDVRYHLTALLDGVADDVGVFYGEGPWLFLDGGVLGGVAAQDGAQSAKLHPASIELGSEFIAAVATDVMAPETIQHIARR